MILDTLDNWKDYEWANERFVRAFAYLEALDPNLPDGKYAIEGDDVFCLMQTFETTPAEGHEFEAHRDFADIQYLVSGEESILWAPTPELTTVTKPYKPDIEFYGLTPGATDLVLTAGRFCVLFPQDAHAPCIAHGAPCTVRKAVVKVRV